jgi:hypothetical protein
VGGSLASVQIKFNRRSGTGGVFVKRGCRFEADFSQAVVREKVNVVTLAPSKIAF